MFQHLLPIPDNNYIPGCEGIFLPLRISRNTFDCLANPIIEGSISFFLPFDDVKKRRSLAKLFPRDFLHLRRGWFTAHAENITTCRTQLHPRRCSNRVMSTVSAGSEIYLRLESTLCGDSIITRWKGGIILVLLSLELSHVLVLRESKDSRMECERIYCWGNVVGYLHKNWIQFFFMGILGKMV